jgi:hypothetical protein
LLRRDNAVAGLVHLMHAMVVIVLATDGGTLRERFNGQLPTRALGAPSW